MAKFRTLGPTSLFSLFAFFSFTTDLSPPLSSPHPAPPAGSKAAFFFGPSGLEILPRCPRGVPFSPFSSFPPLLFSSSHLDPGRRFPQRFLATVVNRRIWVSPSPLFPLYQKRKSWISELPHFQGLFLLSACTPSPEPPFLFMLSLLDLARELARP